MALSNEILASTLQKIIENETDALKRRHAFLDYADKKGGIVELDGGAFIQVPVDVKDHSNITYHSTGYEPTDESIQASLDYAKADWAFLTAPIAISKKDRLMNSGDAAIVSLYERLIRNVMGKMGRTINSQILNNSVTLATSGIQTLYGGTGTPSTGYLEGRTKATQANTAGGLTKAIATYPDAVGWRNAYDTASGAFATNGIGAMNSIQTQILSVFEGADPIDVTISTEACFKLYKAALFVNERYMSESELDGGRLSLMFAGAPITPDLAIDNTGRAGSAIVSAYMLNFNGIKLYVHKDANFKLSAEDSPYGYSIDHWQLQTALQLMPLHLGSCGYLANADA